MQAESNLEHGSYSVRGILEKEALAASASVPDEAVPVDTSTPCTAEVPSPCSVTCSHHVEPPANVSSSVAAASLLLGAIESVVYLRYRLCSHRLEGCAVMLMLPDSSRRHCPGSSARRSTPDIDDSTL